uniref:Leucine-rich repeat-containing N-terminal plant-type domain-containing protein n=1 Tax=Oryza brachyantha TaxID=4533 RepID=J3LAW1_ORYBR
MVAAGFSFLLTLLLFAAAVPPASMVGAQAATDQLALMSFKLRITSDPSSALASWGGNQSIHVCQWQGVTCSMQGLRRKRVVALDLSNLGLSGTIDPSIGNLTYLRKPDLLVNDLTGNIPSELGRLLDFQHVNLSLSGGIPPAMGDMFKLLIVQLQHNMLDGAMPRTIGLLGNLEVLNLYNNILSGSIPPEIGNLTSLRIKNLQLRGNQLSGTVPSFLGNLSSLTILNLGTNRFYGEIVSLQGLSSLTSLILQENNLHEYGLGNEVSILGDIYSYGILLLEMFTGKRPTGSEFGEALSLHNYIQMALPDNLINIVDQHLLVPEDNDGEERNSRQ